MIHFLITHWEWTLLIALVWGAAGLILWNEKRKAVLVDAYGLPVDPGFDADIEQAIANVADREDGLYLRNGHRDHEQPGGVLD